MKNRPKPHSNELRFYDGLSIELDPAEICLQEVLKQNPSEIAKCLVVKNRAQPVKGCHIVLEELEYHFGKAWIIPPNGFEQKALRWATEGASPDGQIDICAHGSARIEIVRLFRFPNPFFGIAYFDGSYGKTHHFVGTYKLRLRIEANISTRSGFRDVEPTIYVVYLGYTGAQNAEIEDLTRVSAT